MSDDFEKHFEISKVLSDGEKSFVAQGLYNDNDAVVKQLRSANAVWVKKYATEVEVYKNFAKVKPSFITQELLYEGHDYYINRYVHGSALGEMRYYLNELDDAMAEKILRVALRIAAYQPQERSNIAAYYYEGKLSKYLASGDISEYEYNKLRSILLQSKAALQFNHGDFLLKNIIFTPSSECAPIDWEFAGMFLPNFDLALLHTVSINNLNLREMIETKVREDAFVDTFVLNKAIAVIREIRLYEPLDDSDTLRNSILPHLYRERDNIRSMLSEI